MIELIDENGVPISSRNLTSSRVAAISVVDHYLPYDTHNLYDVTFHTNTIHTLLTTDARQVTSWLSSFAFRRPLTAGLDVEWRPNTQRNMQNPVATIQICVGHHCLVFQILHSPSIPQSLVSFLADPNVTFYGVGIEEDVEKLLEDYNLSVARVGDLRPLAAQKLRESGLNQGGLKSLGLRVLGLEVEKPQRIARSRWDNPWLTAEQVQYATVDAFLSYEIARVLNSYY